MKQSEPRYRRIVNNSTTKSPIWSSSSSSKKVQQLFLDDKCHYGLFDNCSNNNCRSPNNKEQQQQQNNDFRKQQKHQIPTTTTTTTTTTSSKLRKRSIKKKLHVSLYKYYVHLSYLQITILIIFQICFWVTYLRNNNNVNTTTTTSTKSLRKSHRRRDRHETRTKLTSSSNDDNTKSINHTTTTTTTTLFQTNISPPNAAPSCDNPIASTNISFTLVTQLSDDRLWMIPHHCHRWGLHNPISLAVFTDKSPDEVMQELTTPQQHHNDDDNEHLTTTANESDDDDDNNQPPLFCSPHSLTIQTLPTVNIPPGDYPVNTLRNMALSAIRTTHAMYVDVDFWPSTTLYPLLHSLSVKDAFVDDDKLAVVVPAFSMSRYCKNVTKDCRKRNIPHMPKTKNDVTKLIQAMKLGPFDPTNRGGHGSTLYAEWFDSRPSSSDGSLLKLPCIKSNRYEPYVAFRYCHPHVPPFQEAFTGYGKNKMTFIMHLRRRGYLFTQLGSGGFVVHYPHLESPARVVWNGQRKKTTTTLDHELMSDEELKDLKRVQVDKTFVRFKKWLNEVVEDESRTLMCDDGEDDDKLLWVRGD